MGWDQANRATALWQLGRYEEARAALDEAHSIAAEPEAGFKSQLAYVELIGAQIALSLGNTCGSHDAGDGGAQTG